MSPHLKEAYKKKMEAQLNEWNAQIRLLAAKAENAKADLRIKYADELELVHSKQRAATEKLKELEKELGTASNEAWEKTKVAADKIWDELKTAISHATSKLK